MGFWEGRWAVALYKEGKEIKLDGGEVSILNWILSFFSLLYILPHSISYINSLLTVVLSLLIPCCWGGGFNGELSLGAVGDTEREIRSWHKGYD